MKSKGKFFVKVRCKRCVKLGTARKRLVELDKHHASVCKWAVSDSRRETIEFIEFHYGCTVTVISGLEQKQCTCETLEQMTLIPV